MANLSLPAMLSLKPGVLTKLLQEMEFSGSSASDCGGKSPHRRVRRRPSLLQITGIVPSLTGTDLFPDGGFYIEVSDSSHSTHVSLPPDQTDLILTDRIQIGQLIHVRCLKPSHPVPILNGLRLLPGRHRVVSPSATRHHHLPRKGIQTLPVTPVRDVALRRQELGRRRSEPSSELRRIKFMGKDDESEDDSSLSRVSPSSSSSSSCVVTPKCARKSWGSIGGGFKEKGQGVGKHIRCPSDNISWRELSFPLDDLLGGKADAKQSILSRSFEEKLFDSKKILSNGSTRRNCLIEPTHHLGSFGEIKWPEKNVDWASLPPGIVSYGKELLRQRQLALNAAVDALLEVSVSERLVQCLSVYSEIQLDNDAKPSKLITKFLKFHQDLCVVRLLTQSPSKPNHKSMAETSEVLEKKRCAASWITAAIESDLSQFPNLAKSTASEAIDSFDTEKSILEAVVPRQRSPSVGGAAAADLASALNSDCNRWFLRYIEQFLDSVLQDEIKHGRIASLFCQLKSVDEWLDATMEKDRARLTDNWWRDGRWFEEEEVKACERVRKKIYGILLSHAEYAAIGLETMGPNEDT